MTPEELYKKYRRKSAFDIIDGEHISGIVVGYTLNRDNYKLIMAVTTDECNWSWDTAYLCDDDHIFSMFNNSEGYWYINEGNIVKWKFGH